MPIKIYQNHYHTYHNSLILAQAYTTVGGVGTVGSSTVPGAIYQQPTLAGGIVSTWQYH